MARPEGIPRQFQLGPHVIKVHIVSEAEMQKMHDASDPDDEDKSAPWGMFIRGENVIFIQKVKIGFNASQQLHTFWHEYFHALYAALNESDMQENERLVDQCGLLHTQMIQSAKY